MRSALLLLETLYWNINGFKASNLLLDTKNKYYLIETYHMWSHAMMITSSAYFIREYMNFGRARGTHMRKQDGSTLHTHHHALKPSPSRGRRGRNPVTPRRSLRGAHPQSGAQRSRRAATKRSPCQQMKD